MPYREPEYLPWDGRRVPVTFIGGYLGAGKTTAINDVLLHADRPVAVIVNDIGSVNIDAALIRRRHGDTIELTNGCVCCGSIDEMGAAFDQIRARPDPPDHVLIELSGVAEPQRMLPWGDTAGFMLDGVVVVVAADQITNRDLGDWIQLQLAAQISVADLLILTKTDAVDPATAEQARQRLARLAPGAPVFHGGRELTMPGAVGRFLALGGRRPRGTDAVADATLFDAHEVSTVAVPSGLSGTGLRGWLDQLRSSVEGRLVRAKGMVDTTDAGLVLVQIVGTRCEVTAVPQPERQPPTDLVVISLKTPPV